MHREQTNTYWVFVEKSERKRLLGTPSVDGSKILKLILKKYDGTLWAGLIWIGINDKRRAAVSTGMKFGVA